MRRCCERPTAWVGLQADAFRDVDTRCRAEARPTGRCAALLFAGTPALARAADGGEHAWVAWTILVAVGLLVAGILIRAALGTSTPPGWLAFLARRRAEGRPTQWRDWPDD